MESSQEVLKQIEEKTKQELNGWIDTGDTKGTYKVEITQNGLIKAELYLTMKNGLEWKYVWYYCEKDGTPLVYRTEFITGKIAMTGLPETDEVGAEKECNHYRTIVFDIREAKNKLEELEKKVVLADIDSEGRLVVVIPKA